MEAGRLGSPMTSIVCVGWPKQDVSHLDIWSMKVLGSSPSKGLLRRMVNSPEGGGAMERGILMYVLLLCIDDMKGCRKNEESLKGRKRL